VADGLDQVAVDALGEPSSFTTSLGIELAAAGCRRRRPRRSRASTGPTSIRCQRCHMVHTTAEAACRRYTSTMSQAARSDSDGGCHASEARSKNSTGTICVRAPAAWLRTATRSRRTALGASR